MDTLATLREMLEREQAYLELAQRKRGVFGEMQRERHTANTAALGRTIAIIEAVPRIVDFISCVRPLDDVYFSPLGTEAKALLALLSPSPDKEAQ